MTLPDHICLVAACKAIGHALGVNGSDDDIERIS